MIHRINSVAPDLDDRVIKPNQARDAKNLRFGASTDDSNLSGGVMVNGNVYVSNNIPQAGASKAIGVLADLELQCVYFCLFNSEGAHGVYRIKTVGGADVVEAILGGRVNTGSWLNFSADTEVSMTSIDGKLYFTDGVNQPRMVNIDKGVRTQLYFSGTGSGDDVYPAVPLEWHYTQIKRAPQELLEITVDNVVPKFGISDPSIDYANIFAEDSAWQYSYYYIYDNDEESRLAPITPLLWYNAKIGLKIPDREFVEYIKNISLIKSVVFVYRKNNDGDWNALKTVPNNSNFTGSYSIPNILLVAQNPVSSNITSSFFDAVPLASATNEIAQNRINHGNYLIDYPNWSGLNLQVEVSNNFLVVETITKTERVRVLVQGQDPTNQGQNTNPRWEWETRTVTTTTTTIAGNNRTFYKGYYDVGIELLDEWGRRIAVVNQQTIEIPNYIYQGTALEQDGSTNAFPASAWLEDKNNLYKLKYTVSGTFPSWCKYWRLVYSKNQSVNYFYKTVVKLYYWYSNGNVDFLSVIDAGNNASNNQTYTIKGIAIELTSGEPFLFTNDENQYVAIAQEYPRVLPSTAWGGLTGDQQNAELIEYKITKQVGNILYVDDINYAYYPGWELKNGGNRNTETDYFPLYYQVYLLSKKQTPDQFYYQSSDVRRVGDSLTGEVYGDCYVNFAKKQNQGSAQQVLNFTYTNNNWIVEGLTPVRTDTFNTNVVGVSMNIRNIYSQLWISDIGQPNIVNENQRQVNIKNGICFSDPLIGGTQVNGLSKFDPLDVRQSPLENGPITALVTTNATQREPGVMLAIGTSGVSSFYYDSVQLTNVDGTTNIAVSDRYLASQRPLQGQFGCSQLSSVTKTPLAAVYWWSDAINDFIRYSNAGLERLGLTYLFGNKLRSEVPGKKVCTTYDYITDEVILTPAGANSFVFSERYKTFQGMREYFGPSGSAPERGISISQKMYHFLGGLPWVTTTQTPKSNFFGLVKNPQVITVTNESPSVVKQWNQIKLYGPRPLSVELLSGDAEGFVRQSYIKPSWWIQRKGEYDAAIRRDTGSGDGMTGKIMESRILYSTFVFDPASFDKLNFIEVKSNMSVVQ
jgi:hypothetical protein